ncbi:MAG: hypothetical protein CM1200mP1_08380 [Candidatus Neomarinimicrobiota bacterium]|nr:MAG: hypothetical protein CM1200mP1_08380 [Candidatus Neomarinimicrobiota bacterium]
MFLEPILDIEFKGPEDFMGDVKGDMSSAEGNYGMDRKEHSN